MVCYSNTIDNNNSIFIIFYEEKKIVEKTSLLLLTCMRKKQYGLLSNQQRPNIYIFSNQKSYIFLRNFF
jgi:hypothetical protein